MYERNLIMQFIFADGDFPDAQPAAEYSNHQQGNFKDEDVYIIEEESASDTSDNDQKVRKRLWKG